jgi:hypothetical protein
VGGILILPAGFFLSPRALDVRVRSAFLGRFRVTRINYFETPVFHDTDTTVAAFRFEASPHEAPFTKQTIPWFIYTPSEGAIARSFVVHAREKWIVGGDIYRMRSSDPSIQVGRVVDGTPLPSGAFLTDWVVSALDSGVEGKGRLGLSYDPERASTLVSLPSNRTFARLWCTRRVDVKIQEAVAERFNRFIEQKRAETHSLFLPSFRESKEYARKRIPFELVYRLVEWLMEG